MQSFTIATQVCYYCNRNNKAVSEEKYAKPVAPDYAFKIYIILVLFCHLVNVQQREEEHLEEARNKQADRTIIEDELMGLTCFVRATILESQ